MPGILGKKIGMSQVFTEEGNLVPVTIVEAGPCVVVDVKTKDRDGYQALQLGFGAKKEKNTNKPTLMNFKKKNLSVNRFLKEFKDFNVDEFKIGDDVKVDIFKVGDKIKVRGIGKGKGFQGVMRRHGFGGVGGTTHGQSDRLRAPGSIGSSSYPSRVFKGQRMAGSTGGKNVTTLGLRVVKINSESNLLFIKGSIPGAINSVVEIYK